MLHNKSIDNLLDIKEIYLEPEVRNFKRGLEILEKYPEATLTEVDSHWKIAQLFGFEGSVEDWISNKKNVLILGIKKSLSARLNSRSSNWVAPSQSNGCTMSCSYCYVPRRKGFANPITIFVNIEQICNYLRRHASRQGPKSVPDHIDPNYWVYEIGENGDCSADAAICDNVKDLIALFREVSNGKLTFATKFVNRDLLNYDPQEKTRIRFSLMPHKMSKLVDVRTTPISDRIDVMNDFADAGYEVNVNFAPVIFYDGWLEDWKILFDEMNDKLNEKTKKQLITEIIFLTHNEQLHEVNMNWHPKAEDVLWRPEIQEVKYSQTGGRNVRYKRGFKKDLVDSLVELVEKELPYCPIRYAF
ncbi:spore photoproduct lyase family protein [Pedobacter sp. SYSU D00535]|uniref:spore photoproduct lyase family protein n=1 Tax=Pedobacter sp. SYSU D00535 TaxID=2810308 RepID=UPI001A969250|nr:spore photoproduct lyase family protein [Pedobacter sp. SYSU D00535]